MLKIINVSSFKGAYTKSIKVTFMETDNAQAQEGSIELSGYLTHCFEDLLALNAGDRVKLKLSIDKIDNYIGEEEVV